MYLVYVNPIGASGPDAETYHTREVALEVFRQACTPVLTVEAWLIYIGPNPVFPERTMQTIEQHWHM